VKLILEPGFYIDGRGALHSLTYGELCDLGGLPRTPESIALMKERVDEIIIDYLSRPCPLRTGL
jgi:hypothetical protein